MRTAAIGFPIRVHEFSSVDARMCLNNNYVNVNSQALVAVCAGITVGVCVFV